MPPTWNSTLGQARVCIGERCFLSFDDARYAIRHAGGLKRLLPHDVPISHDDNRGENCPFCNGSVYSDQRELFDRGDKRSRNPRIATSPSPQMTLVDYYCYSPSHPQEAWNVTGAIRSVAELPDPSQLDFKTSVKGGCDAFDRAFQEARCRSGFVPSLLPGQTIDVTKGWRSFTRGGSPPFFLPCSSARGEDAALLRSFFVDADGKAIRGGTFLELGGVDGLIESNTFVLERCFGWRGVLIEGHPLFYERLRRNRPASLSIHLAACASPGWVKYDAWLSTGAKVKSQGGMSVECSPIGDRLLELGVHKLSLVSIDVEGSELTVVKSLLNARREGRTLSLGVVLVEVRADGQRRAIMEALLNGGMRYVGQLRARGSEKNDVVDDCFVNVTHLRLSFPQSRASKDQAERPSRSP